MKIASLTFRRAGKIILGIIGGLSLAFVIYFPGRQTPIAFKLATGIGISNLQERVDQMENKAIGGKEFTEDDKQFLANLYTCFAKGGRLTVVLRQSSQMMRHYLLRSGQDLKTGPRIFINSKPVRQQMQLLKKQILQSGREPGVSKTAFLSETFYMGDPEFIDSFTGLYFGHIVARPVRLPNRKIRINWRFECPWEWPTYASLRQKYGHDHAQRFPIPNPRSILYGSHYALLIGDGLGGHLATLGIAKPFLVYSEWMETMEDKE